MPEKTRKEKLKEILDFYPSIPPEELVWINRLDDKHFNMYYDNLMDESED